MEDFFDLEAQGMRIYLDDAVHAAAQLGNLH